MMNSFLKYELSPRKQLIYPIQSDNILASSQIDNSIILRYSTNCNSVIPIFEYPLICKSTISFIDSSSISLLAQYVQFHQ